MPQASVDPQELISFAAELKRFNAEVESQVTAIRHRFGRLGETWRDQEHRKFADFFDKVVSTHTRLTEAAEQQVPVLTRKAQKIQDYLGPRAGSAGSNSADISSPDVIREFRLQFMKFEERAKQAVAGVHSDADRVVEWLRHEQSQYWKQEHRKAEEAVRQARAAYLIARHGSEYMKKPSYIEEEKALKRAERRKEEAERKLELVKKWGTVLEQQAQKLMGAVNGFAGLLESTAPMARARLETMAQHLDEYLRDSPGDGGLPG
jgi:uncharacterized protein YukE